MRIIKRTAFLTLWLGVVLYFLSHGDEGLTVNSGLKAQADALEAEVLALRAREEDLRDRVGRLRGDGIDLDYLEERARVVLNLSAPGELMVPPRVLHAALHGEVDAGAEPGYVLVRLE